MLQIVQHQKSGEIKIEEMPVPQCYENGVLIEVCNSVISAGTERTSVENTKGSLIARAKKQPEQVKQVIEAVKSYGLKETTRRVRATLNSYKLLGYSAAGIVRESKCDDFKPGDRVAAAGAGFANHSEYISVPKNLTVKIPENVSFEDAAYTTVGSIAMQGVRQAEPELGESVAVIGLGLLGLITVQLLKSAGCKVIGLDINERSLELGKKFGCDVVLKSSKENVDAVIANSGGYGVDSTILTASTSSNEPMQLAMQMTRKKGKVVIVGAVGMEINRNPFYKKEIDLRISSSYGPGRYDALYEESGIDYPYAFVRWTENRNMQAFLELISTGKMDVSGMTSHKFKVQEANKAYDLISKNEEDYLGILIKYPSRESKFKTIVKTGQKQPQKNIKIGFIGAGQFAQNYLLPPLSKENVTLKTVVNATSTSSKTVANNFKFENAGTDPNKIINDNEINTVFIASRHDSHAEFVINSLKNGKNVYVEKPLALNKEELENIKEAYSNSNSQLMVGFNRRFSKSFKTIKNFFDDINEAKIVKYRVNAGFIPPDHWVQRKEGGGRIIGEACHFIDIMLYLTGSKPVKVYAGSITNNSDGKLNEDNIAATIKFADGSLGILEYFSNGDKSLPKEYCEVHSGGSSAVMNDFKEVTLHRGNKAKTKKMDSEKGIKSEILEYINSLEKGSELIKFEELYLTTLTTFEIIESLNTGQPKEIGE